ncbi:MAG TPA: DUF1800 domain-containing protein [Chloroflexota bacterium]|nr:DUF1800 domain-containing protein [Chloroflexota bacterium]
MEDRHEHDAAASDRRSRRRALATAGAALATTALPLQDEHPALAASGNKGRKGHNSAAPRPQGAAVAPQSAGVTPPLPDLAVVAYNRLAYGPRPGDIGAFHELPGKAPRDKLHYWVEQQLRPESIDDQVCDAHLTAGRYTTMTESLQQLWYRHYAGLKDNDPHAWEKASQPYSDVLKSTLVRAVYSRRQLYEVLVHFWHNHFNVRPDLAQGMRVTFMHYDRDVIRSHALGNFRTMLGAVAASPTMLYYLDNATSSRGGPNENYARELFELHTMGAENYLGVGHQRDVPGFAQGKPIGYVDDDVYEATRCFTGWRINDNSYEPGVRNTGTFLYYPDWHDRFEKMVLGRFLPPDQPPLKDGHDVMDALVDHPGTGRFIARKLCRRLIADDPPERVVQEAARVFTAKRHAPDQIAQVVRTIIYSDEFATTWGQKIKQPYELVISGLRALGSGINPTDETFYVFDQLGQPLFGHLTPDGYPDKATFWSGTSSLLTWWNVAAGMLQGYLRGAHIDLMRAMPPSLVTPDRIADYWIGRILGRPMYPSGNRDVIVAAIAMGGPPDIPIPRSQIPDAVAKAVALILMSPDFFWR